MVIVKPHKYNASGTTVDGISFPSKKEASKYRELKLLLSAGIITKLELQPKFLLQPGFIRDGKAHRPITYVADFRVTHIDGTEEVIDAKGVRTKEYLLKKKMLLYNYPDLWFTED